ncbi:ATP-binding cassette domain-containing protein [Sphingomonas flavalba]|uniref:ATP-binding cassette domain-containing protein n=1 Tax=Sphingomonas flavalba TaxID=2559804 RepID=UPI00109E1EE4|nr:ATP-binding cassette domain-containing protein [Sphingomonas flavalba]
MSGLIHLIPMLARQRGIDLDPDWHGGLADEEGGLDGRDGLRRLATHARWPAPRALTGRPKAEAFPLLVYTTALGWAIAEQWENEGEIRIATERGSATMGWDDDATFFAVELPDPVRRGATPKAIDIFWRAILSRRGVLGSAALATVVANIIALATSLYSMQVYDRVIPRGNFATLWVLTVGVVIALAIDFALRSVRALMIEREAALIDTEVSEFFFARSQAVRLDARPPGVGTMASQLRGLEQVRALMSSGSLFLVADLPFALLFLLVIAAIGGVIVVVPLVTFPIALLLGWLFAWAIKNDTDKAQVSGNRKNGLLVESLDSAETVKANRGQWQMLGRWNRLMDEVHHYEDPVKRWSSMAGTIFSTMQQGAYVAIIAFGAVEVAAGNLTMGGLIACAIIAGRVNGPLVTMLPGFIVQWGYARSSLQALDGVLALPMDDAAGTISLRPERLSGPLRLEGVKFAYPGTRDTIDVPRLEIRDGEKLAIIGGVGSGKSTLLRLIAGLYAPQDGRVLIGGLDMGQIATDVVRRHIGYLPQDFRLVNGTLRDNLLLGLSNPGDDRVMEVARQSGFARMVAAHPRGLDLPISEGGRGLSGGQRALTGLTRLLLAQPPMMLLDEPSANLDQATESAVFEAIKDQLGQRGTMVLVTHKLQLLALVDRVVVMAGGRIVLDGTTSDVIARLAPLAPAQVEGDAAPSLTEQA